MGLKLNKCEEFAFQFASQACSLGMTPFDLITLSRCVRSCIACGARDNYCGDMYDAQQACVESVARAYGFETDWSSGHIPMFNRKRSDGAIERTCIVVCDS